jgi:hypothetical protein
MIYKFKSKAAGDVIMLGPQGDRVLGLMGKPPARQGIIEVAQMPAAIAALQEAIAADEAWRAECQRAREAEVAGAPGPAAERPEAISLRQRAWPLIDMMQRCHRAEAPIVWGV